MKRRIVPPSLVLAALLFLGFGTGASAVTSPSGLEDAGALHDEGPGPVERPFKLKGGGQIDVSTFSFNFAGTATHLGLYFASGAIDPATFQIQGTMTAADSDTLNWAAQFQQGPLGEFEVTLMFKGGTGRFTGATGSAAGPIALDPDFMFTINLQGTIAY